VDFTTEARGYPRSPFS